MNEPTPHAIAQALVTDIANSISLLLARHATSSNAPLTKDIRDLALKAIHLRRAFAELSSKP